MTLTPSAPISSAKSSSPSSNKEVNEGKNFATLRQVYYSLILAVWFKKRMKESLLGRKYMDQKKSGNPL